MTAKEILDAPVLPERIPSKFERERHAFRLLMPGLLDTHEGKYIAVHNEQVVGWGDDQIEVARAAYEKYGYVPIYVSKVTRTPAPPVRVPSPRIRRSGS